MLQVLHAGVCVALVALCSNDNILMCLCLWYYVYVYNIVCLFVCTCYHFWRITLLNSINLQFVVVCSLYGSNRLLLYIYSRKARITVCIYTPGGGGMIMKALTAGATSAGRVLVISSVITSAGQVCAALPADDRARVPRGNHAAALLGFVMFSMFCSLSRSFSLFCCAGVWY